MYVYIYVCICIYFEHVYENVGIEMLTIKLTIEFLFFNR